MTSGRKPPSMLAFYETDLSTQQPPPQAHARVPPADADAFRTRRAFGAPPQGAQKNRGVSFHERGAADAPRTPGRPPAGEGFSRGDRLRKRREFEECYASGVRVSGRFLQVFLLPETGPSRLGISVPKRAGSAVTRNRIRRRLREIFRRNRDLFGSRGMRLVVNARASAGQASFSSLKEDLRSAVARAVMPREPRARE